MKRLLFSHQILILPIQITWGNAIMACCVKNKPLLAPKLALWVDGDVLVTVIVND